VLIIKLYRNIPPISIINMKLFQRKDHAVRILFSIKEYDTCMYFRELAVSYVRIFSFSFALLFLQTGETCRSDHFVDHEEECSKTHFFREISSPRAFLQFYFMLNISVWFTIRLRLVITNKKLFNALSFLFNSVYLSKMLIPDWVLRNEMTLQLYELKNRILYTCNIHI